MTAARGGRYRESALPYRGMGELGTWLVRAREARGLTLEDADRDTRISRRYLLALEAEQFDVIPAPVYARGFLRSYSQYLGLDPQEMLALFPRDDEYLQSQQAPRASHENPLPATSPSRPTWERKPGQQTRPEPISVASRQTESRTTRLPGGAPTAAATRPPEYEPVIGVDIGVPAPARRIKPDPAAQARSVLVAVVAIGGILAVILLAFVISNLGGDNSADLSGAAAAGGTTTTAAGSTAGTGTATANSGPDISGIAVTRGVVPDVQGETIAVARAAVEAAGFKVNEIRGRNTSAAGTVYDQSPAAGTNQPAGSVVTLAVSDGP